MGAESGRYLTWPHFGLLEKDEKTATSPANSSIKSRRGAANFDSTQHNGYQISRPRRRGRSAPRDCVACSLSAPEPPQEALQQPFSNRRNSISLFCQKKSRLALQGQFLPSFHFPEGFAHSRGCFGAYETPQNGLLGSGEAKSPHHPSSKRPSGTLYSTI